MRPNELEALYSQNFSRVYSYVYYRLLDHTQAEDVTSAVFEKVVRNYARFDPHKSSASTWIMRITHNTLIDYYRTQRTYVPLESLGPYEPSEEDELPDLDDSTRKLSRLLSVLSPEDREIVFLKYHEEKRNVEIAALLGMKAPTVATRLRRALATMRKEAESQGL